LTTGSCSCHCHLLDLHSFPTRRSSDLEERGAPAPFVEGSAALGPVDYAVELAGDPHEEHQPVDGVPRQRERRRAFAKVRREVVADRKSTRLNSSHGSISYAVFCLKKKN